MSRLWLMQNKTAGCSIMLCLAWLDFMVLVGTQKKKDLCGTWILNVYPTLHKVQCFNAKSQSTSNRKICRLYKGTFMTKLPGLICKNMCLPLQMFSSLVIYFLKLEWTCPLTGSCFVYNLPWFLANENY